MAEPISFRWRIANATQVDQFLLDWGDIGRHVKAKPVSMGSPLIYAGPIDRGFFLSGPRAGQISRRRGGVHFMRTAKRTVLPLIGKEIADQAIRYGPSGVYMALIELARKAATVARNQVVAEGAVRTGNLRDKFGVYVGGVRVA